MESKSENLPPKARTIEIVKPPVQKSELEVFLTGIDYHEKIKPLLNEVLTPERFVSVVLATVKKVPKLAQCTKASLFQALYTCAQLKILPDNRKAHLIPYGDQCQLIVDYKGLIELARRSGEIGYIHCDVVCKNDKFQYCFGTGAHLNHVPAMSNRGDVISSYSFVRLKDGTEDFDVMNLEEIEKIRMRSKAKDNGPWKTDYAEMCKKTVFRRHSKWLPCSVDLLDAYEAEDEQEKVKYAKPVFEDNKNNSSIDMGDFLNMQSEDKNDEDTKA